MHKGLPIYFISDKQFGQIPVSSLELKVVLQIEQTGGKIKSITGFREKPIIKRLGNSAFY
jgi:hypothetical protein